MKATPPGKRSFNLPTWWRLSTGATLVAIPAVWVAYLIVVPVMAWSTVSTLQAWPGGARPPEQPGTTYLVVGSDSRKGLTEEEAYRFLRKLAMDQNKRLAEIAESILSLAQLFKG